MLFEVKDELLIKNFFLSFPYHDISQLTPVDDILTAFLVVIPPHTSEINPQNRSGEQTAARYL